MHTEPAADLTPLIVSVIADMDDLVAGYLRELSTIPAYQNVPVPADDLAETTRDCLELILRKIGGLPLATRHEVVSEALGARRAAQGIPLDALLSAVRMVFRLLWVTLHERATPEERDALNDAAVDVWEAIEFHTVRVHAGHLHETSRIRRSRETQVAVLLTRFLEGTRADAALTEELAHELGLRSSGKFWIAAAPISAERSLRNLPDRGNQTHIRNDSVLIIGSEPLRALEVWALNEGVPIGIGPTAARLSAVPASWRVAHDLLMSAPPSSAGPRTVLNDWPDVLSRRAPELIDMVLDAAGAHLQQLPPVSRELLLKTVDVYARTGSISLTAAQLFVHRNTVLKRLSKFADLTGIDPGIPWGAATLRLIVASERHHGSRT